MMHDATAALHNVASSAVVPLLMGTTIAAPGEVHLVGLHFMFGTALIFDEGRSRRVRVAVTFVPATQPPTRLLRWGAIGMLAVAAEYEARESHAFCSSAGVTLVQGGRLGNRLFPCWPPCWCHGHRRVSRGYRQDRSPSRRCGIHGFVSAAAQPRPFVGEARANPGRPSR